MGFGMVGDGFAMVGDEQMEREREIIGFFTQLRETSEDWNLGLESEKVDTWTSGKVFYRRRHQPGLRGCRQDVTRGIH